MKIPNANPLPPNTPDTLEAATVGKKLSLLDSAMLIMGSMIGSGIFIVSAGIARDVQTPGLLLLVWVVTGIITIFGALSYGELAAMMPKAGGQYVYLKEAYNPRIAFLYGWTLFTVIQTGTIAAVAVAFAKFTSVFFPIVADTNYLFTIDPVTAANPNGTWGVSVGQLLGIAVIFLLTFVNFRGVRTGALVQNVFGFAKIGGLVLVIALGLLGGYIVSEKVAGTGFGPLLPDLDSFFTGQNLPSIMQSLADSAPALALVLVFFAAMVGSLFSSDAWNNITFTAGEVSNPKRNLPLSLILGTGTVTLIYLLANVAYLNILPFDAIATAPNDRVGTLLMETLLGPVGRSIMAILIMISTFGCINGVVLAGARVYYTMARDGLFFAPAGQLNAKGAPAKALLFQAIWASLLTLSGQYNNLLDFVMLAVILFYILTVAAVFILRRKQPDAPRPYRTIGYPLVPAIYILLATLFCLSLIIYKPNYSLLGLGIVLLGFPIYFLFRQSLQPATPTAPSQSEGDLPT